MYAAMVVCSNGQKRDNMPNLERVKEVFALEKIPYVESPYIFEEEFIFSASAEKRAKALMDMYQNPEVTDIFDISGGDIANEILPYLDYELIKNSDKTYWGFSDLTTVLNAIYTMTGKASVLYQLQFLAWDESGVQVKRFKEYLAADESCKCEIFAPCYEFKQGSYMKGVTVGGNIRCFLKLAGTKYWPDLEGKILVLEALGSDMPQIATFFAQLSQLGAFEKVKGVVLGTFITYEKNEYDISVSDMLAKYVPKNIPIAVTKEIGHGATSKAIYIGKEIEIGNFSNTEIENVYNKTMQKGRFNERSVDGSDIYNITSVAKSHMKKLKSGEIYEKKHN